MMNFIVMTMSVTIGVLLASIIMCIVVFNKKFLSWYTKKTYRMSLDIVKEIEKEELDLD